MKEIINPELKKELNLKLSKIVGNPKYFDKKREFTTKTLRSIGDIYSFWIENPELREKLLFGNKQEKTIKKLARIGIANIHNGWYCLEQIGKNNNFLEELNEDVVKKLNKLVQPKEYMSGEFRNKDVSLNYKNYTPPSWEKVPIKLEKAISRIKSVYHEVDSLTASITAHLELAAIQPFFDANKRVARLVQDRILYDAKLPPVVISAGEGKFYRNLLGKTLFAYGEKELSGQKQFYDYCASKVNNGLDEIINDL